MKYMKDQTCTERKMKRLLAAVVLVCIGASGFALASRQQLLQFQSLYTNTASRHPQTTSLAHRLSATAAQYHSKASVEQTRSVQAARDSASGNHSSTLLGSGPSEGAVSTSRRLAVSTSRRLAGHGGHHDDNEDGYDNGNSHGGDGVQVTILHFNDWHVRVEPTKEAYCALCSKSEIESGRCSGGLARMSTFIKEQRAQDPDLLLLNAGDDFIGTEWDRRAGVDAPAAFMNLLRPDAMTIGNHEWDKGLGTLNEYLNQLNTDAVLGANINFKGHRLGRTVEPYVIKNVKGKNICILGLTTQYSLPDAGQMEEVEIEDPYKVARDVMRDLESQSCDATVLLSHLGYTADIMAAKLVPGLDVIIGGHSHSLLWPDGQTLPPFDGSSKDTVWGSYPTYANNGNKDVPVVQASWGSRYMGKLVLTFKPNGKVDRVDGEVFLLGGPGSGKEVAEDQEALDEIKRWRDW